MLSPSRLTSCCCPEKRRATRNSILHWLTKQPLHYYIDHARLRTEMFSYLGQSCLIGKGVRFRLLKDSCFVFFISIIGLDRSRSGLASRELRLLLITVFWSCIRDDLPRPCSQPNLHVSTLVQSKYDEHMQDNQSQVMRAEAAWLQEWHAMCN